MAHHYPHHPGRQTPGTLSSSFLLKIHIQELHHISHIHLLHTVPLSITIASVIACSFLTWVMQRHNSSLLAVHVPCNLSSCSARDLQIENPLKIPPWLSTASRMKFSIFSLAHNLCGIRTLPSSPPLLYGHAHHASSCICTHISHSLEGPTQPLCLVSSSLPHDSVQAISLPRSLPGSLLALLLHVSGVIPLIPWNYNDIICVFTHQPQMLPGGKCLKAQPLQSDSPHLPFTHQLQLCHVLAVWSWTSYLTSLGLSFFVSNMRLITRYLSHKVFMRMEI